MGVKMKYGSTVNTDGRTAYSESDLYTETLLWENPDRTVSFAAQDVTLDDAVDGYDYLRITYAYSTGSDESTFRDVIIPVWNGEGTAYMYGYVASTATGYRAALLLKNSSNVLRARSFWILEGGEQIHFFACSNVGSSGSGNTGCIPVYIYGIETGGSNDGE